MEVYKNKKRGASAPAVTALVIITAIIAGGVVYLLQNIQVNTQVNDNKKLTEDLSSSKVENDKLKKQVDELEKDILTLKSTSSIPDSSNSMREIVEGKADKVLHALKDGDMTKLAAIVHPDKGVRFSSYSNVNLQKDIVITAAAVPNLMTDTNVFNWGVYDGSGEPINLTFEQYHKKFIFDVDFLEAPQIVFNEIIKRGNIINNVKESYPGDIFIEYHFPGFETEYNGMDWRSLILIFEKKENTWYLVGIAHDQWTI